MTSFFSNQDTAHASGSRTSPESSIADPVPGVVLACGRSTVTSCHAGGLSRQYQRC
jgi:hypothetical protein